MEAVSKHTSAVKHRLSYADTKRLVIYLIAAFVFAAAALAALVIIKYETEEIVTDSGIYLTEDMDTFTLDGIVDVQTPEGYEPFMIYEPEKDPEQGGEDANVMFSAGPDASKDMMIRVSIIKEEEEYISLTSPMPDATWPRGSVNTKIGKMYYEAARGGAFAMAKLPGDRFLAVEQISMKMTKGKRPLTEDEVNAFKEYIRTGVEKH